MKFIVDAQLPGTLSELLNSIGHQAIHTLDLPDKNRTPDAEIIHIATEENRIVITKDSDFLDSHLLTGYPPQLLVVSTGDVSNAILLALVTQNLAEIEHLLSEQRVVVLDLFGVRATYK